MVVLIRAHTLTHFVHWHSGGLGPRFGRYSSRTNFRHARGRTECCHLGCDARWTCTDRLWEACHV